PHRRHRPLLTLLLERDVQLARLRFPRHLNGPDRGDLVLPLGAELARALLLERGWMYFAEEPVEQVRGLIAAVEAVLGNEAGELQHDLVARRDARDDGLRIAVAE